MEGGRKRGINNVKGYGEGTRQNERRDKWKVKKMVMKQLRKELLIGMR